MEWFSENVSLSRSFADLLSGDDEQSEWGRGILSFAALPFSQQETP